MSPRKVRMVVDLIRGRHVNEAYSILKFSKRPRRRADREDASLRGGQRAAEGGADGSYLDTDELVVSEAYVNEGRP
jgi:large subunit ribosomal protein L22